LSYCTWLCPPCKATLQLTQMQYFETHSHTHTLTCAALHPQARFLSSCSHIIPFPGIALCITLQLCSHYTRTLSRSLHKTQTLSPDPYPFAESGGGIPNVPSLLLATSPVVVPDRSRRCFPSSYPTLAAVEGDGLGEPLPPDPHCPGGVGQGCVVSYPGAWRCGGAAAWQGHV